MRSITRGPAIALATLGIAGATLFVAPAANAQYTDWCSYTSSEPTLSYGSTGTAVKQLQCEINDAMQYPDIAVDGSWGPATDRAVRHFQSCAHISSDGIAGPQTWSKADYWSNPNVGFPSNC